MSFFKYILTPRLYKVYRDGSTQVLAHNVYIAICFVIQINCSHFLLILSFYFFEHAQKLYEPVGMEKWGDKVISTVILLGTHSHGVLEGILCRFGGLSWVL